MVGNSLRSDILPVVAIGGMAIHIPYQLTWAHEHVDDYEELVYLTLEHIGELPGVLERLQGE